MKRTTIFISLLATMLGALAQTGKTLSVMAQVTTNSNGTITINWPAQSFTGSWQIFKRKNITDAWSGTPAANLAATATSWTDASFTTGSAYEYSIYQVNSSNQAVAVGYLYAGNKTPEVPTFGSVILLVDSNYIKPLAGELTQLKNDLAKDGWVIKTIYAGRGETPPTVKARISAAMAATSPTPRSLYIIGHVPVPYSGYFSGNSDACAYPPDGHVEGSGNHTGAWPADLYYGDFTGTYTDATVNLSTGLESRLYNIPGDGKFDQCKVAGEVTLEIGRVDLYNMPIFNKSDTVMVSNYLNKAHLWRKDSVVTVERGLVDDNFTTLSLSHTGWIAQNCMVRADSIFGNRDYFTAQNAGAYLWSYGCGPGSFNSCSGIGAMNNWNPGIFNNIFTALAGSFFGDWDNQNNFLRGPIATGSLCSFWGGIPTWYMQHMGLGLPIGVGAKYTQNSKMADFNGSENGVYIALMGDPTIKVRNVPMTGKLKIASVSGKIQLNWGKAKGKFDGYCVFKVDTITNTWTRVNASIITDTFYTADNWVSGKYKYAVRTIRLETNPSGSWYNLGQSSFGWVTHTNNVASIDPLKFSIFPNPSVGTITVQMDDNPGTTAMVSVIDLAGKTVFEDHYSIHNNQVIVSLPENIRGGYLIRCSVNGRSNVGKILVNR